MTNPRQTPEQFDTLPTNDNSAKLRQDIAEGFTDVYSPDSPRTKPLPLALQRLIESVSNTLITTIQNNAQKAAFEKFSRLYGPNPTNPEPASVAPTPSVFSSKNYKELNAISIEGFLTHLTKWTFNTGTTASTIIAMRIFMDRYLKKTNEILTQDNVHLLILLSFLTATKLLCDNNPRLSHFEYLSEIPRDKGTLYQLEISFGQAIEFNYLITEKDFKDRPEYLEYRVFESAQKSAELAQEIEKLKQLVARPAEKKQTQTQAEEPEYTEYRAFESGKKSEELKKETEELAKFVARLADKKQAQIQAAQAEEQATRAPRRSPALFQPPPQTLYQDDPLAPEPGVVYSPLSPSNWR